MADYFLKTTNKTALLAELGIVELVNGKYQDSNFILDYIGVIKKFDAESNVIGQSDSDRLNIRTFNNEFDAVVTGLQNAEAIEPPETPYRIFG